MNAITLKQFCTDNADELYLLLGQFSLMVGMTDHDITQNNALWRVLKHMREVEIRMAKALHRRGASDMYRYDIEIGKYIKWTALGQQVFDIVREIHDHDTQRT